MTLDPSLGTRRALIGALRQDAQLIAVVPATRIWPAAMPETPDFPFIFVPMLIGTPAELDGGSGSRQSGIIHCFTELDPAVVPDPEAQAATINAHIARVLSGIDSAMLADGELMSVLVSQTQIIRDPASKGVFHGLVSIVALVN